MKRNWEKFDVEIFHFALMGTGTASFDPATGRNEAKTNFIIFQVWIRARRRQEDKTKFHFRLARIVHVFRRGIHQAANVFE